MNTLLSLILFVGVPTIFLGISFAIGCKKSKYLQDIIILEELIKGEVTRDNFHAIMDGFDELQNNNWNYRRTKKAFLIFNLKYKSYVNEEDWSYGIKP